MKTEFENREGKIQYIQKTIKKMNEEEIDKIKIFITGLEVNKNKIKI